MNFTTSRDKDGTVRSIYRKKAEPGSLSNREKDMFVAGKLGGKKRKGKLRRIEIV